MGGGNSKPADEKSTATSSSPPQKKAPASKAQEKREEHAHSAPVRRDSDAADRRLVRRGSMMPSQEKSNAPRAPGTKNSMLNGTHSAMHRGSTVARTRLTRDKVKGLNRDEFDTDEDDEVDVFNREANAEAEEERRRAAAKQPEANFGRRGKSSAAATIAMGNEAGGDLSGAAASNLAGGIGKKDQAMVKGTTVTGRRQRAFFNNDEDLEEEPAKTTSALAKAKQKAKTVGVQQELQRRQTARDAMGGTLNQTKSFGGTLSSQSEVPMINGTPKIKTLLDNMRQFRYNMRGKRDMSDNDIQDLHAQQQQYANVKIFMAKEVASLGRRVDILARQVKDQAIEFVDSIVVETDSRGGNVEVLQAFMKHLVTIPWTQECLERGWLTTAVRDGSAKFMDILLQLPMINDMEIELDPVSILEMVVNHKTNRIALALVYLKHWSTLSVSVLKEEMAPHWQKLFIEVASHKRAIPNEDRSSRMGLINKILSLSHLISLKFYAIDQEDDLSIISRCIAEGDSTLMSAILSNADVDWNYVVPETGHSALSHAIAANHKIIVELILGARGIDVLTPLPVAQGHALDYAKKLKANPGIIAALEHKIKGVAGSAKEEETSTHASLMQRKRKEAAAKLEPKIPEFITNPPPPAGQDTDDWILDTSESPVVATQEVLAALNRVLAHQAELFESKKKLLDSPDAEARFFELEERTPQVKKEAAEEIMALGKRISVEGKENKEFITEFVAKALEDQETENNCMLVRTVMFRVITVDFAPLITAFGWAVHAVHACLHEVIETLLKVSKLWAEEDVVELFNAAMAHQTKRIPLVNQLLKHENQLRLSTHAPMLRAQFQDFFEGITNPQRALPSEDRAERKEVLYRLFASQYITLQFEQEFTGSQTIFSRACRDGDIELVQVMVELRVLRDINRIHSNKSTAIMQAVVGNQVEVVKLLAADPSVDVTIKSPHGTALELAQKMRKDQAIVAALKAAGG
eukprot:CAMPEP_0174831260 /NCGR_PEP_ID=MMETSP1114-20130205/2994_1 /TAXON_ID=312471 /ORGANISM="Neobodo designis, Strain CCAP 1951/1" /LENGTH=977 /DNA_ID=CAMNT_0016065081 /DNA_START=150 /DNA_END=3083 /DNA_ORIENTATION=+